MINSCLNCFQRIGTVGSNFIFILGALKISISMTWLRLGHPTLVLRIPDRLDAVKGREHEKNLAKGNSSKKTHKNLRGKNRPWCSTKSITEIFISKYFLYEKLSFTEFFLRKFYRLTPYDFHKWFDLIGFIYQSVTQPLTHIYFDLELTQHENLLASIFEKNLISHFLYVCNIRESYYYWWSKFKCVTN